MDRTLIATDHRIGDLQTVMIGTEGRMTAMVILIVTAMVDPTVTDMVDLTETVMVDLTETDMVDLTETDMEDLTVTDMEDPMTDMADLQIDMVDQTEGLTEIMTVDTTVEADMTGTIITVVTSRVADTNAVIGIECSSAVTLSQEQLTTGCQGTKISRSAGKPETTTTACCGKIPACKVMKKIVAAIFSTELKIISPRAAIRMAVGMKIAVTKVPTCRDVKTTCQTQDPGRTTRPAGRITTFGNVLVKSS